MNTNRQVDMALEQLTHIAGLMPAQPGMDAFVDCVVQLARAVKADLDAIRATANARSLP